MKTPVRQHWREERVSYAKSQLLIEGVRVSQAAEANIQHYVSGEITVQEALSAALARHNHNEPTLRRAQ